MRHPFLRTLAGSSTDPNFENVTLLLHGDGTNGGQNNTFVDGSTNNFSITRNGNTTQGTFSPYGDNWSNYFDGTGDRLKFPDSADWDFGTGDFTIEFWFALNVVPTTSSTTRQSFVSHYKAATPSIGFNCQLGEAPDNKINFGWGDTALAVSAARTWSTNRWYHYAVARSGTSLKLFIDGEQVASVTDSTNMTGSSNSCTIGALNVATSGENFIQHVNGYVSNVRILKGTALYTAAFTPPTAPLTAITNTVLLTCQSNRFKDNSSSNRTATRDGDVSVQRFSPFSPTAAYAAGTIGGSGYFDGNGDYLKLTGSALGTSQFCVELWYYPTASLTNAGLYDGRTTNGSSTGILIRHGDNASSATTIDLLVGATTIRKTGLVINSWNHIAVCRNSSNTTNVFVNGSAGTSATISTNLTDTGVTIGAFVAAFTSPFAVVGYVSNLRVVVGSSVYDPTQSTLTVPTSPLTAITNTSLLLNFTNAAIFDNAMMAVPETVGNAQIDTTTKKFGTGSLEFDGTGDWLLVPDSIDQRLGTGNFTIECWLYLSATGTARGIVGKGTSTTGWLLSTDSSNKVVFTYTTSTIISTGALSGSTWYHIAVVREGTGTNQTKIYIDGTNDGTGTVSTDFTQTNAAYVGANRTGGDPMNGYIDDLRITKGVARYTANFTAPTAAFPDL